MSYQYTISKWRAIAQFIINQYSDNAQLDYSMTLEEIIKNYNHFNYGFGDMGPRK